MTRSRHWRILGALFWAFALLQLVGAAVVAARPPASAHPVLFWLVMALLAAAYVWVGARLRARSRGARPAGIALCLLALLSFPVGTALGLYGLWVLFRRPERPVEVPPGEPARRRPVEA